MKFENKQDLLERSRVQQNLFKQHWFSIMILSNTNEKQRQQSLKKTRCDFHRQRFCFICWKPGCEKLNATKTGETQSSAGKYFTQSVLESSGRGSGVGCRTRLSLHTISLLFSPGFGQAQAQPWWDWVWRSTM